MPLTRKNPIQRSTKPIKRSRIKRKPRPASETKRIYGGKKRIEWVKSLPCAACGVVGYSENAHVAPASEKGTGYKAGFEWIVPLCGERGIYNPRKFTSRAYSGCHNLYDEHWGVFNARFPLFNPTAESAKVEAAWIAYSGSSPIRGKLE